MAQKLRGSETVSPKTLLLTIGLSIWALGAFAQSSTPTPLPRTPAGASPISFSTPHLTGTHSSQSAAPAPHVLPRAHLDRGLAVPSTPTLQTLTASCGQNLTVDGQVTGGAWSGAFTSIPKAAWGLNNGIPAAFQTRWDSQYL